MTKVVLGRLASLFTAATTSVIFFWPLSPLFATRASHVCGSDFVFAPDPTLSCTA